MEPTCDRVENTPLMTRNYSAFLPPVDKIRQDVPFLTKLGWQTFFSQQTDVDELAATPPARVTQVHRNSVHVIGETVDMKVPIVPDVTIGDWVLLDQTSISRVLHRSSLIKRRAPGHDRAVQYIAANIDTAFLVTSCNADFKVARLERYIALAFEADVAPVIVLTKKDLTDDLTDYIAQAQSISETVPVVALNAKSDEPLEALAPWCKQGQTVAFLGSSGVGKSTLVNTLAGREKAETQDVRAGGSKGRHTTTHRHLHMMPNGSVVMDTPGMRELQLTDAAGGVAEVFADLFELSTQCKFNDCAHQSEPGCAVRAALENGDLDHDRFKRWQKLEAEERFNTASLSDRRQNDRAFHKAIKEIQKHNRK
ncbi:ribosome small subunit-dependent GTPase A [Algirhabdus cladophorae]|uniref:ribosome small subunit-dependent GTPase A n=1 Tax=Algirhabdus cladophorae TaxID=3377108 RepID=UPI003B84A6D5